MSWLDHIERRFRRFAIPNLTGFLAGFQAALWLLMQVLPRRVGQGEILEGFLLIPAKVMEGEFWRLATFVFLPPGDGVLAIFGIYLFWLMGTALEGHWGTVRFNFYVLISVLATIIAAFLLPNGGSATNMFIDSSVFLAFELTVVLVVDDTPAPCPPIRQRHDALSILCRRSAFMVRQQ